ncbi:hypothetical protein EZ456_11825 [Pedobacter psychrodurus]|uniref:Uncharacterized protein n=1 Tax=Pedobacter psychrodurus TaxID=2530456 RepID=A0A4R0PVM6_9SPHI|nr:hypothetical protein [Pedobacter psychrodurus]TCD26644.1 hypothetical protein EZ456_11825 [Pedobacter psychrodurus]
MCRNSAKIKSVYFSLTIVLLFISTAGYAQRTINDVMDSTTVNHLLIISKKYGSLSLADTCSLNSRLLKQTAHKQNIKVETLVSLPIIGLD